MVDRENDVATSPECDCKVGRSAERYALADLDAQLVDRWLGESGDPQSLRSLEGYVNQRILEAAMAGAEVETFDGEAENVYRLLTDEDASQGRRTETRNRLARAGVDVPAVESAFVSHQTVHRHLTECLDVNQESDAGDEADRRERALSTVAALRNRTEAVTETSLQQLARADALSSADFDVFVDVSVTCGRCGRVHSLPDLVRAGGCSCS